MKLFKLTVIFLVIFGCKSQVDQISDEFILNGKTNGIDNGAVLKLFDPLNEEVLDSTTIENNTFQFKGKLVSTPLSVVIHTNDHSQYKFLWIENENMTFDASNSDFQNAVFQGSKLHEWAQENLFDKIDTIEVKTEEDLFRVREIEMQFVEKFPENIISANILSVYASCSQFPLKRIKLLYEKLSPENKKHSYGKTTLKTIKTLENLDFNKIDPQIGDNFIDFTMIDTSGKTKSLSENLGKVTLLEFWASWCGPCIAEIPNLVQTNQKYNSLGFNIFAVSLDNNEKKWKNSVRNLEMNWINVSDLNGNNNYAALQYGVDGIPDNFLINSNGEIIARNLRGDELNSELNKLLN